MRVVTVYTFHVLVVVKLCFLPSAAVGEIVFARGRDGRDEDFFRNFGGVWEVNMVATAKAHVCAESVRVKKQTRNRRQTEQTAAQPHQREPKRRHNHPGLDAPDVHRLVFNHYMFQVKATIEDKDVMCPVLVHFVG